jgi:hypothetical protein
MMSTRTIASCVLTSAALGALACSDEGSTSTAMEQAQAQTPPMGAAALEAWLATGAYKDWQCEEQAQERGPFPHGVNRICSNATISSEARGSGDWPDGAASVKEIFEALGDAEPIGYAVLLKTAADGAGGDNWYWYERVADTTYADGLGVALCVDCHETAGSTTDALPGARDMVFTPLE